MNSRSARTWLAAPDLFTADGVLAYPFAPPGHPAELRGREAIRAFFALRTP